MSNTLRYQFQTFGNTNYEAIHLKLLGIDYDPDLMAEKGTLTTKLKTDSDLFKRLTRDYNENGLKQSIKIIEREIERLDQTKKGYKLDGSDETLIDELNNCKYNIGVESSKIADVNVKHKVILESVNELKSGASKIDANSLKAIYEDASVFLPALHRKFEEVLVFHNSMVENKIAFLMKSIESDTAALEYSINRRNELLVKEKVLLESLNNIISLDDYNDLIFELNKQFELKGKKEALLEEVVSLKELISAAENRLEEINTVLSEFENTLEENETIFNKYFSEISDLLYGEKYLLSHDISSDNYSFRVQDLQANKGGGKKKGEIASFDLAYIKFCDSLDISAPRFVLHDSPEDVHINQLVKLVEIANDLNGQFIVSVLKDKFMSSIEAAAAIEDNKILELSENDKLFKF